MSYGREAGGDPAARRRSQGFAPRFLRAGEAEVEAVIRRLTAVQLDSISAVDRAHRLTITARGRAYPAAPSRNCCATAACSSTGRTRRRFYDRAVAALPPRDERQRPLGHLRSRAPRARRPRRAGLGRIREEGRSRRATSRAGRRRDVELEAGEDGARGAVDRGVLVIAGRRSFQRSYDLAERVIPREWLEAPVAERGRDASNVGRSSPCAPTARSRRRRSASTGA